MKLFTMFLLALCVLAADAAVSEARCGFFRGRFRGRIFHREVHRVRHFERRCEAEPVPMPALVREDVRLVSGE